MRKELKLFRATLLSSGAALGLAAPAFAQDADEQTDEIVVTGFRSSLENSVAAKRDNSSIIEAVSAEDIGKLPDISIAESLGRLPGLATQRLNGRAQGLSIRGLGPDFSTALLNGREQVTTSDNRGVEFDQYPAELLSQAVVYKTPFAGLVGQGLAGTVDLRTIRPLDKSERIFNVNARYEFNEDGSLNPDASGDGYRVVGTYVDQFADDTVGVAIGVAVQSSPSQGENFNAWGYGGGTIDGQKSFASSVDLDRVGVMGTLQYHPTDNFTSTIDIFYSDFAEDNPIRGIETGFSFFGTTETVNATNANGIATDITFDNVRGVVRNDFNRRRAELVSAGWNGKFDSETWGLEMDISYSKADREDDLIESYSGTGYCWPGCDTRTVPDANANPGAADTINAVRDSDGFFRLSPTLNYADTSLFVLTDPLGWGQGNDLVQAGFINSPDTVDELLHLRASVNRDLDTIFSNVEVGVDYSMREKTRNIDQQFLTLPGNGVSLAGGAVRTAPIPAQALVSDGSDCGLTFFGIPGQVCYDPFFLLENGFYQPQFVSLSSFSTAQDWTVEEDIFQAWVKFNVDTNFIFPLTGNIGAQLVHTDQSSLGFRIPTGVSVTDDLENIAETVEDGDKFTDILPSLNLNWELGESTFLRLGASRTLARARMDQLNASLSLGVNTNIIGSDAPGNTEGVDVFVFSAGGGNPRLRPYIANQVDLSLEHYFGGAGYISVAGFYKDLEDYVNAGDTFAFDFSDFIDAELTPAQAALLNSPIGPFSRPSNNGSGSIKGFEFSVSLPGTLFGDESILAPFGVISSTSYTDSEVTLTFTPPLSPSLPQLAPLTISIPGLSKWVVNSTLYFEKGGFEARVSHRYRSQFLAEVSALSATRTLRNAKAESIFDAQIGYTFGGDGALGGTRVTVQGLNLTDEPFVTFNGPGEIIDHQSYGRTYLIGVSKTF
ncbi:MAG TPA: TonB-dependent receptor [Parvularcula sp.]|nr:TonB-dependent receptor [Parvularcula sp.]HBS30708.1 TonB-dependent receptor [Parvularcula sp.]